MRRLPGESREEMADRWIAEQPARLAARNALPRSKRILDQAVAVVVLVALAAVLVLLAYALVGGVFAAFEESWRWLVVPAVLVAVFALGGLAGRHR